MPGNERRRPQARDGAAKVTSSTTSIVAPGQVEYRVTWRRAAWSPTTCTKSRAFSRRYDAEVFAAKLRGGGRPDLSPAKVEIHHRPVGAWVQGWPA